MVGLKDKNTLTFSDAYGLSLIVSGLPGVDHAAIVRDLSPQAKRIGNALIAKSASRKNRPATKKTTKAKAVHR